MRSEKEYWMSVMDDAGLNRVARIICDQIVITEGDCEKCPYTDRCSPGHNGLIDYWKEGVEE